MIFVYNSVQVISGRY